MLQRISAPLILENNSYRETSFEEAFLLIYEKLKNATENATLVMSSGDYSNEFLYNLQKLSRIAFNSNALSAFDYYGKGTDFFADKNDILPFAELFQSDCFYCAFDKNSQQETLKSVLEILNRCPNTPEFWFNDPDFISVNDFYLFFRCINLYILKNNLEKGIYVNGLGKNYSQYKTDLLTEDIDEYLLKLNLNITDIQHFTDCLLKYKTPAFLIWEPLLSQKAYHELENLCMLIEIQSKPAAGFLCIKPDINSQGLYDMGVFSHISPGGLPLQSAKSSMESVFDSNFCSTEIDVLDNISSFKSVLFWNPLLKNIPQDILSQVEKSDFSVLHSAYYPHYNQKFNLVLPANLPEEISGVYTDSAKIPHNYSCDENKLKYNNLQQLSQIAKLFGLELSDNNDDIFLEYISFMQRGCNSAQRHFFK